MKIENTCIKYSDGKNKKISNQYIKEYPIYSPKGITLIALVITIIVLLILSGIVINLIIGENGIIRRTQESKETYKEQEAREKLELVLLDLQANKVTDKNYNSDEYINTRIQENGMVIEGDVVLVDGWQFQIDRSVPKIIDNLKGDEVQPEIPYKKENLLVYLDGEDAPVDNVWKDRSGNNNNAVMSGTYTHDANKKAYTFTNEIGQGKITKFEYKEGVTISTCIEILEYDSQRITIGNGYLGPTNSRPTLGIGIDFLHGKGGSEGDNPIYYPIYEDKIYTITFTIDHEGNGKIYVDGELVSSLTLQTTFPAMPSNDFRIRGYGSTDNTDYNEYLLPVNLYNVLVYDGALSQDEVKDIYQTDSLRYKKEESIIDLEYETEDLLVYLDGEDAPVDNVWKDRSGNNNNAVMSGTYIYNVDNKSYDFTNEEGQGKITKFNYTKGVTISSLLSVNSSSADRIYIGNGYYGPAQSRPTLGFNSTIIQMISGTNAGNTTSYNTLVNKYYTITMTVSENGSGKTYINGKLISQASLATNFPATPANDFRIRGYGSTSNTDYYTYVPPASIKNVLVYDRELSQEEVKNIYEIDKAKH